jgi:hypothetical protein
MIGFIKTRMFRGKVLLRLERQLIAILGKKDGEEALGAFATTILNSDIPKEFLEQLRLRNVTVEDASLAYFDASITAMKRVLPESVDPEVLRLIERMELGLDKMFLSNPGLVVPRNGSAGPMMADFTKEY